MVKTYSEISFDELKIKMNNNETFVIYIGSNECSACAVFSPKLDKVINKYNIDVDYINVGKLDYDEINELMTVINFGASTPKVFFVDNGEYSQYNQIKGNQPYDMVIQKFKENGYIGD
jgi:predicted bacteriocin transport accessory protein